MATQSFFSNFNWFRSLPIGAGLSFLVVFLGCQNPSNQQKQKPIYVDQTYYPVIKACADVYTAKYHIDVPLISCDEGCILKSFIEDSSQLIIGSFNLTEDLKAIVKSQGYSINAEPFAYSAIIGISATQRPFDLSKNITYYLFNQEQNTVAWLKQFVAENSFGFNHLDTLFGRLITDKNAVGILNLLTLHQYKQKFGWKGKDSLNILPVKNNSSEVFPNSVDIANGTYKFYLPINFMFKKERIGHEARFLKFLFQRDGQKIIQKEGLVPLLNFERNIEVKNQ